MSLLNQSIKANYYFEQICHIPHPSFHEDHIADYIEEFAKAHQYRYVRDDMNNIVIYADATPGYEDHETIILQGHMDMVPSKTPDSTHDFEHDPLDLYIEDGWLKAKNTTLGGDDGVAVAYMLALLDEKTPHPSLECVFTVQEEVGLLGAEGLDASLLKGRRLISLDETDFGVCCTSSLGGRVIDIHRDVTYQQTTKQGYTLAIDGLLSGHSSADIHQERANAIIVLARLLNGLDDVQIAHFNAGSADNVIPGSGTVSFVSDDQDVNARINQLFNDIKAEYETTDPDMTMTIKLTEITTALSKADSQDLIDYLYVMPNGCFMYSRVIKDYPVFSSNIGTVRMNEQGVDLTIFYRSSIDSQRDQMLDVINKLSTAYHFTVSPQNDMSGWAYDPHSPLREQLGNEFKAYFDQELIFTAAAGGLETGVFKGKIPDLDIVIIAPTIKGYHTPLERLDINSFEKIYGFLKHFLSTL